MTPEEAMDACRAHYAGCSHCSDEERGYCEEGVRLADAYAHACKVEEHREWRRQMREWRNDSGV